MSERSCSFCEQERLCRVESLYGSWVDYLMENTELYSPFTWQIVVCAECYKRWRLHREQYGYVPNDPKEDEELREMLDEISHLYAPYERS